MAEDRHRFAHCYYCPALAVLHSIVGFVRIVDFRAYEALYVVHLSEVGVKASDLKMFARGLGLLEAQRLMPQLEVLALFARNALSANV